MKILKILLLFYYIIQLINSSPCPQTPDYSFEDAECDSDFKTMYKPTVYVRNFYYYTNITCTPSPLSAFYNQDSIYQINLDYSTNYTIVFTNPNCPNGPPIEIQTSSGPALVITQPKCINSYAIIDFDDGKNTSYDQRTFYFRTQQIELPFEYQFSSIYSEYFSSYSDGVLECSSNFYLYPGDSNILNPDIQITAATCGEGGRIVITNSAEYSSITLYNSSNSVMSATSDNNNFESLSAGQYYFILESGACGKQRFDLTVDNGSPQILVTLQDDSCPKYPVYDLSVEGRYTYSIYKQAQLIASPFIRENGQSIYVDIDGCGTYSVQINDIFSYPPIHYTVSSNTFCQEVATLEYNTTQITDLLVQYVNTNINQLYNVTMLNSTSFNVYEPSMFIYQLSSPSCYSESIQFIAAKRDPHVIISSNTNYCNELVDITVTNWLDFELLYIYNGYSTQYHVNGVFKQVPNQRYQLYYQRSGYCNTVSKYINTEAIDYTANVYASSEVVLNPNCDSSNLSSGVLQSQIFDGFTNEPLFNVTDDIYFYSSSPLSIYHSLGGINNFACDFMIDTNFTLPEKDVTITTVQKPICQYQQDGAYISITSSIGILEIIINDQSVDISNPTFEVKAGYNTIFIAFINFCDSYSTVYFVESEFPSFAIEYDVIPVSSCNNYDGGFTIKDYSKYQYLGMDGTPLVNGSTGAQYPSRTYPLDFSIQLGNSTQICQGTTDIFVSTSFSIIPSYRIVQKPLCEEDDSGVVIIDSIKDIQGTEYSISSVNGNSNTFVKDLTVGTHTVLIQSGTCGWNINITLIQANVTITPVLDMFTVNNCYGMARYKLVFSDELAAQESSLSENPDPVTKFYATSSSQYGEDDIEVYFRNCRSDITIKVIEPTLPSIKYSVTLNDNDCISTTVNIQVENFQDYETLKYGDRSIDSDGFFLNVIPGGKITGTLIGLDCTLEEQLVISSPSINYSALNETCNEGYNGQVNITDIDKDNYYYFLQNIDNPDEIDYQSQYPITSDILDSEFSLVGSKKLKVSRVRKSNPSCIASNEFELSSVEPELIINVNDQCSLELGSVSVLTTPSDLTGTYELGDPSTPTPTPTQSTRPTLPPLVNGADFIFQTNADIEYSNIANNISAGNYSFTYTITSEYCKRKFYSYVNVPYTQEVNVSATACQTIQFTPGNLTATYYYTIFDPNQTPSQTFNSTGLFNYTSFKESGSYILQVSTGTCIKNHTIQIEKCESGDKKNNIGLIVGLVIGLVALAGIIAAGIFIYKKRRASSTKVNDVEGIQHELNTVKVYTGNKLQELDKF